MWARGGGRDTPAFRSQAGLIYGPWHGDGRQARLFWIERRSRLHVGLATLSGAVDVMLARSPERLTQARPGSAQGTVEGLSR